MNPVIGIYHADPDPVLRAVTEVVPGAELRLCTRPDALAEILPDIEVLLAFKFGFQPFPREQILSAPQLKWVQLASAGVDHICPFDPQRITVTNGSGVHGDIMSQYVFGALAVLMWDFPRLLQQQKEHAWVRFPVRSLTGMTMGIIGLGSIGASLTRHARAYGMRVIGTRRSAEPIDGVDQMFGPDGTEEVLAQADIAVIAAPLTHETRDLVGARALARMRPDAYLVAVSRGGVVNEAALADVLANRRIAGAVLDVFTEEPLPASSPFWDMPNTLVTPHVSGELADWSAAVGRLFADNLQRYVHGQPLRNVVDPQLGY